MTLPMFSSTYKPSTLLTATMKLTNNRHDFTNVFFNLQTIDIADDYDETFKISRIADGYDETFKISRIADGYDETFKISRMTLPMFSSTYKPSTLLTTTTKLSRFHAFLTATIKLTNHRHC
ncbi:unnamed protein product [Larinioides sclopetarius]|uniref:Uncharacterized protein n=1 Tax=Larinioides sclopetarius TaxID=280406 RepID=A0AAV2C1M5_9ARAC